MKEKKLMGQKEMEIKSLDKKKNGIRNAITRGIKTIN